MPGTSRDLARQMFQLTAARRRLGHGSVPVTRLVKVSTHSRPEAAGLKFFFLPFKVVEFQLTAARRRLAFVEMLRNNMMVFQLTAARRRLERSSRNSLPPAKFQLTAARRRLVREIIPR